MTRFVGVSEIRRCECGRPLKDYQDKLCYSCVSRKLNTILRVLSKDPELVEMVTGGVKSEQGQM